MRPKHILISTSKRLPVHGVVAVWRWSDNYLTSSIFRALSRTSQNLQFIKEAGSLVIAKRSLNSTVGCYLCGPSIGAFSVHCESLFTKSRLAALVRTSPPSIGFQSAVSLMMGTRLVCNRCPGLSIYNLKSPPSVSEHLFAVTNSFYSIL